MDNRICAIIGDNYDVILVPFTVKEHWGFKVPYVADCGTAVDETKIVLSEKQKLAAFQAANSVIAGSPEA